MQLISFFALSLVGIASAIPTPQYSAPPPGNTIKPTTRSQYEVSTGAIHYDTPSGKIFKNGSGKDITTLLTFDLPASLQGKTCSFYFNLDATATATGTTQFDLFSSLNPATQSTISWPPGNERNQFMGRLQAVVPGEANYVADVGPTTGASFPCPYGGKFGYELVGAGDQVDIEWTPPSSSSYISWS
jgi:hypothetical protein